MSETAAIRVSIIKRNITKLIGHENWKSEELEQKDDNNTLSYKKKNYNIVSTS